jgi:type VI protein secretion system component Hcp
MLLPHNAGGPSLQYALVITLTNVFVSQVGSDSSQNNVPLEKLSLSFDQIKWDYTVWQDDNTPGPTITTTYDVTENQVGGNFGYYSTFVYSSSYVSPTPFQNETPFSSLAVQLTNSATSHVATGAGSGAAISPLSLIVPVFKDTFGEFGSALKGTSVPLVTAHYSVAPAGAPFDRLRYDMTNAQVTSVAIDTTSTGSLQETLGFDFTKIKWTAWDLNADGSRGAERTAEWSPGSQPAH